jgi:hypothetical protein
LAEFRTVGLSGIDEASTEAMSASANDDDNDDDEELEPARNLFAMIAVNRWKQI